ncbi:SUR7/PalI family-domain-containing protein [Nemania sp. FL0916]|nr:SUR7/PalI family-domain-containing protein [Nemania sp. FL0916]
MFPRKRLAGFNWAFAIFLSLFSLLATLITLLSGVGGHVTASYLTIDVSNLSIPSKLAHSVFLQDLSQISGADLVGSSSNAQSLGLADKYTVSLLTACGHGSTSTCFTPHIGFAFNPSVDLALSRTTAQQTLLSSTSPSSSAYRNQLHAYSRASTFVSVTYILTSLLTLLSCITIIFSRQSTLAGVISRVSSGLVALLILAATITSIATFVKTRDVFNTTLGELGVRVTINGSAFAFDVAASVAAVGAFVLVLSVRPTGYRKRGKLDLDLDMDVVATGGGGGGGDHARVAGVGGVSGGVGGLLNRVPTWNRPRYVQLGGKGAPSASAYSRTHSPDSDREGLIDPAADDGAYDGMAREGGQPQSLWARKQNRHTLENVPTAYEPNTSTF